MTQTVEPNAYSPFATADPRYRHIFSNPFFRDPEPNILAVTSCEELAVAPKEMTAKQEQILPGGLCPDCVSVHQGGERPPPGLVTQCEKCQTSTRLGKWCAMCRMEQHDEWWPTRNGAVISAVEIECIGLVLAEMSAGDVMEITEQTGPMHPGRWRISSIINAGRTAVVNRLRTQCTCGGPLTTTTLPSGTTYEEHRSHCAVMQDTAGKQPVACRNCKGSGLDPRHNGEFDCPDCTPASAQGKRP